MSMKEFKQQRSKNCPHTCTDELRKYLANHIYRNEMNVIERDPNIFNLMNALVSITISIKYNFAFEDNHSRTVEQNRKCIHANRP